MQAYGVCPTCNHAFRTTDHALVQKLSKILLFAVAILVITALAAMAFGVLYYFYQLAVGAIHFTWLDGLFVMFILYILFGPSLPGLSSYVTHRRNPWR